MPADSVLLWQDCPQRQNAIRQLLATYGLQIQEVSAGSKIPGSFWGDEEAGLIENRVYVRPDTPLHSIFHEAGHAICMGPERRKALDTDALSDDEEENAVCYLQILLADHIPQLGRDRMMADMDRWGYSFRLGSTRAWFEQDAEDARHWLDQQGLLI